MIDYSWVPWFKELVGLIAEHDERWLVEQAKAVDWGRDDVPLLQFGDENIDPLSFLYSLAQRNTSNQFEPVFGSVHEVFDISVDFPSASPVIPTPDSRFNASYHNRKSFSPGRCWRLFRQAAKTAPAVHSGDFDRALDIPNVGIKKLTQTLFIVNPTYFLPADNTGIVLPQPEFKHLPNNYEEYAAQLDTIKKLFPGCELYEINTFLWAQWNDPLIAKETSFFQVSTRVYDDSIDYWEQSDELPEDGWPFKENNCVYTEWAGDKTEYPLKEPKRGDVILVCFGPRDGRAIGVIEKNGYASDSWDGEEIISVYWINKTSTPLSNIKASRMTAFSRSPKLLMAFRETDAYKVSFDWIDQLTGDVTDDGDSESQPYPDALNLFPLNTILFGPPGTGKTWEAVSYAVAIMDEGEPAELAEREWREYVRDRFEEHTKEGRVGFVTFHQNYAYEDFIEGIRPVLDSEYLTYKLRNGIFKNMSIRAKKNPDDRYVLIIDEINRGNIAKVFGELITLIEPSKRLGNEDHTTVKLPYSRRKFGVPNNLYIVGTMNTADRSIALLDTALRRRFDFIEKMPDVRHVAEDIEGVDGRALLKAINERIKGYLDREHQIGHTYLIDVETIDELAEAFQRRIMPLLQEYFYDDWAKIVLVLNGNPFICKTDFSSNASDDFQRTLFDLLPHDDKKWWQAESYQKIYDANVGNHQPSSDGGSAVSQ